MKQITMDVKHGNLIEDKEKVKELISISSRASCEDERSFWVYDSS